MMTFSYQCLSGVEEGSSSPNNSTNATATEYIILLCAIPNGSIIDSKQGDIDGAADGYDAQATYTPECSAKASLEGTQGQVIKSDYN